MFLVKGFQFLFCLGVAIAVVRGQESTDKCDATELSKAETEADNCILEKEISLANILGSNIQSPSLAVCQNIQDELKCLTDFFSKCYDQETVDRVKRNFLYKQSNLVLNNTFIDFQSLMQECDILLDFQLDYMKFRTGSNKCSFVDYIKTYVPQKKACDKRVDDEWALKLGIADFLSGASKRQYLITVACDAYNGFTKECLKNLLDKCFTPEIAEEVIEDDFKDAHEPLEIIIKEKIDDQFSFEGSCSNLVSGLEDTDSSVFISKPFSKRSAEPFASARAYMNYEHFDL